MSVSKTHGLVDLVALIVGAALIGLLFVLCLQLLQVREASVAIGAARVASDRVPSWPPAASSGASSWPPAVSPTPSASAASATAVAMPDPRPNHDLFALAGTRIGLTMTCVLLAGAIGGYFRYVRERFDAIALDKPRPSASGMLPSEAAAEAALAFVARLIIGLGTASVVALFIPLAIADPPGLAIYNPWALLILGVGAGYLSSSFFNGLQSKLERIFNEIQRTESIDERTVTSAAKQGVLDALGAPTPVNFDGKVSLAVVGTRGEGFVLRTDDPPGVSVTPKASYVARVLFMPRGVVRSDSAGDYPVAQRIRIEGGVDAPAIPFDLQVMWTGELSRERKAARTIAFDRARTEHVEDFEFTVPTSRERLDEASASLPAEITLFVRQHGLVCAVVSLPVRLSHDA